MDENAKIIYLFNFNMTRRACQTKGEKAFTQVQPNLRVKRFRVMVKALAAEYWSELRSDPTHEFKPEPEHQPNTM